MRFLILPEPSQLNSYLTILERYRVSKLIRASEKNYDENHFAEKGITIYDFEFPDGKTPSPDQITKWLKILDQVYFTSRQPSNRSVVSDVESGRDRKNSNENMDYKPEITSSTPETIAVHCRSGLGRSALLIAIALIYNNMDADTAVNLITLKRPRVTFTQNQLTFLSSWSPPLSCIVS